MRTEGDEPAELHTVADDEAPVTEREAEVAGMVKGQIVYGDSSVEPNADDHADAERASRDEHV
jgi:hypothetical protein